MKMTTLCYLKNGGRYLMLHRTKKQNDINEGKWIGIGGKFECGESPEECMLREFEEETGLKLTSYALKGIITFVSDVCETEYMHLFTADGFEGNIRGCDEGELEWINEAELLSLNLWEGDRIFLDLMQKSGFFTLKLEYCGEKLVNYKSKTYF